MAKRKPTEESFTIPHAEAVAVLDEPVAGVGDAIAAVTSPPETQTQLTNSPPPIEPGPRSTVREALNKIYHKGFYFDGFARPGDGLVQFLRMLGRTGVRRDDRGQALLEQHSILVEPLLRALDCLVPDGFELAPEGNAIGPEPFAPPGPADELMIRQMSGGAMVIVPLPLNGERPVEINLGPVVIDRTQR